MLEIIVNKVLTLLLFLSLLTAIRHGYYFVQAVITSTEEQPKKYKLSKTALLFLGLSIAYVLSAIFTGIKI